VALALHQHKLGHIMVLVAVKQRLTVHRVRLVLAVEALTVQEVQGVVPMVVQEEALQVVVLADQDTEQAVQADAMEREFHQVVAVVEQDLLVAVVEDVVLGAMVAVVVVATGMASVQ
jgi:hypothetical protein